jgi:putative FmdB family regulatory protein
VPDPSSPEEAALPTYQYSCTECGHFFEQFQSFSEDSLTVCPECEGRLRKVFNAVGVVFKGSGFYRTDSRTDGRADGGSAGSDGAKPAAEGSSGSSTGSDSTSSTTKTASTTGSKGKSGKTAGTTAGSAA